jgi:linoleoyl-CoA desaturase
MPNVSFERTADFQRVLTGRVEMYFLNRRLKKRDNLSLYLKAFFFLGVAGISYTYLVFVAGSFLGVVISAAILSFALLGVGFNIQHDGNHGAFSRHKLVNRLTGMMLDLLGTSSHLWRITHNISHHTYTNVPSHDGDMEYASLVRLSEYKPKQPIHRYQHIYVWGFYMLAHLSFLVLDYRRLLRGKAAGEKMSIPWGAELAWFVGGKIVFYSLAFIVPMMFCPVWAVIVVYVAIAIVIGLGYQLVAQSAHIVQATIHPSAAEGKLPYEWFVYQILISADFAAHNWFWTFYLGGLNFQREHHLFPRIAHIHYPAIAKIVKQTCDEFKVAYYEYETFREALVSHYRFVKAMGT